jgi:hypothetical protein
MKVARKQVGKHVPAVTNTHVALELKMDDLFFQSLLVSYYRK